MKYVALDFETGGLDPNVHGPCSLGLVWFCDGEVIQEREWLFKPARDRNGLLRCAYEEKAFEVNGYSLDQLESDGMDEFDALCEMESWVRMSGLLYSPIVSHNTAFDAGFLSQLVYRCGSFTKATGFKSFPEPLCGPWYCTRRLMRRLDLPNSKLDTLVAHYGMGSQSGVHGAVEDARLCGQAFWKMRLEMAEEAKAGVA